MIELMNCQMCGGSCRWHKSYNVPTNTHGAVHFCEWCKMCSPIVLGTEIEPADPQAEKERLELLSAIEWNEMQRMIARGKLLDEPTLEYKPTKRRL